MSKRLYEDARATTGVTVDVVALSEARRLGLNVSEICSNALIAATRPSALRDAAQKTLDSVLLQEKEALGYPDLVKKSNLEAFLSSSVPFFNVSKWFELWSKQTGLSVTELKELKFTKKEKAPAPQKEKGVEI